MRGVHVALAAGLVLLLGAVAIVASGSPQVLARTSEPRPANLPLASVPGGGSVCQGGETLPAGTTAIAVSLFASAGPRVSASVRSRGGVVTHGSSASGWIGKLVTIPVAPRGRTLSEVTACFSFKGAHERVTLLGTDTGTNARARDAARSPVGPLPGRLTIEYLRAGSGSWWSRAGAIARRMGLGRAWAGSWVAPLAALLLAASVALASWLLTRRAA